MDEESKKYTAFSVGNLGFFECERMPFGLCNAPATFQRAMQNTLGELNLTYALIYLDDVIVFSRTEMEHLERLRAVLERFREQNLRLKPSKCEFFKEEITYLAHRVSKEGVRPSLENLQAIAEFPPPENYTDIRAFLGLAGHYRRFIKGFSQIAAPLMVYLAGDGASKKKEKLELSESALAAFYLLKDKCMNAPVLALADYSKPFLLETDASKDGLGAVLSQKQDDGRYHPVAFGSRSLTKSEKNYHSSKLEFLALKWAVADYFYEYLGYGPFVVRTDNNPLTYIMKTPNLDATGHRWVGSLAKFNFELEYQKGKDNTVADILSRMTNRLEPKVVQEILDAVAGGAPNRADVHDPRLTKEADFLNNELPVQMRRVEMHVVDWAKEQTKDPVLRKLRTWLLDEDDEKDFLKLLGKDADSDDGKIVYRKRHHFVINDGKVYLKETPRGEDEALELFVVPKDRRIEAVNGCHRDAGHQGQCRTMALLRERFWFPRMEEKMRNLVQSCTRCRQYEAAIARAPLMPITATYPNELLHADFTTAEVTHDLKTQPRTVNVLVLQDHFTKYTRAFVTPDQKAKTVAEFLYKHYISIFGAPSKLLTDQGANFTSQVISELCATLGIRKMRTSSYHPQTNGQVERTHQTLMRMIGKLDEEAKDNWASHLSEITHAYNSTRSAITGYSPHYLMFGRRPKLPIDLIFPTSVGKDKKQKVDEFVSTLKDRLIRALQEARHQSSLEAARQKRYYDSRISCTTLRPGDLVFVKTDAFVGKRKLKDRWDSEVWRVERPVAKGVPTFILRNENGQQKIAHRNRLLLISPSPPSGTDVLARTLQPSETWGNEADTSPMESEEETPLGLFGLPITLGELSEIRPIPNKGDSVPGVLTGVPQECNG